MNQQCKVCGEPAAGFHFGAFTCEGCKSFFGRSYNNLTSISECKNQGACVINKKNRTSCKACRLRKCLLVGMSKSGSRYGRRSNWFKIHCLLQEQQHQQQQQQQLSSPGPGQKSPPPPPLGLLGPHALHQHLLSQQQALEQDMLEYKHSSSPSGSLGSLSGSSPESHNSDMSVEVGEGREGREGRHAGRPGATTPYPARPVPHKDHLFMPLSFMLPHHPAFLPPHPLMFPPGYLPRAFNNNNNESEYVKRFYPLPAPPPPPAAAALHYHHPDEDDEEEARRRRRSAPAAAPAAAPRLGLDDRPMDLSVRGGVPSDEMVGSDSGAEDDGDPRLHDADEDASDGGVLSDAVEDDEDEEVDVEVTRAPERTLRVIPLDLSART